MTPDLDRLVSHVECVLFDFDGPICAVFAGYPARDVAATLRTYVPGPLPADVEATEDPMHVLAYAITVGGSVLKEVEVALAAAEDKAVLSATATSGAVESISGARRSGRRVAFVSNNSAHAVARYLSDHDLIRKGDIISARSPGNAQMMKPDPQFVTRAVKALGVTPSRAVLVGDTSTDVAAAHAAGAHAIGYANKPGKSDSLRAAGADVVITDMHALVQPMVIRPTHRSA